VETEDLEDNALSFSPDAADGDGPSTTGEADIGATQLSDIDLRATGRTFNVGVMERSAAGGQNLTAIQASEGGGLGSGLTPLTAGGDVTGSNEAADLAAQAPTQTMHSIDYSGMTPLQRLLTQNNMSQYFAGLDEEEIDLERWVGHLHFLLYK